MSVQNTETTQTQAPVQPINRLALVAVAMAAVALAALFLSGMAVIAVFVVGAGHVALTQIQQGTERGRGLAITALAIGYAIASFALVSAIIYAFTLASQ